MLDWLTAERFAQCNREAVYEVVSAFLAQPDAANLSEGSFVHDVPPSINTSYEGLDQVYGRMVWDKLYQPLRLALMQQFRMPRHTSIIFG